MTHVPDKELISKIHKELPQINNNDPVFLNMQNWKIYFLRKEETQDINGQESHKKCSSLVITEIQISTTMRIVPQMTKNRQCKYLQGYETTGTPTLLVGDKNAETTSGHYLLFFFFL